jgi:hypothetical protein
LPQLRLNRRSFSGAPCSGLNAVSNERLNSNTGLKQAQEARMRSPGVLAGRKGLHTLTRKYVADVLVSSLATVLVMVVFGNLTKLAGPVARDDRPLAASGPAPAAGPTRESLDEFMERVALSHVASPKAPLAGYGEAVHAPAGDPAPVAAPQPTSRQIAAQKHERPHSGKAQQVAAAAKVPPPAQPPLQRVEPFVASSAAAPPDGGADWLHPLQYGLRLAANVEDIVTASSARVVDGVLSVGGALTSFVRKPQS